MTTNYARKMAILSSKIFGEIPRSATAREVKIVQQYKKEPLGVKATNYYPQLRNFNVLLRYLRHLGIYHDEHVDFVEEMAARRVMRGKGPPKKGEGKRAKKKK